MGILACLGVLRTPLRVLSSIFLLSTPLRTPHKLSVHRDARSDHGYLTTDACEWSQCGCLSTVGHVSHHVVVGQSPDRRGESLMRRRCYGLTVTTSPAWRAGARFKMAGGAALTGASIEAPHATGSDTFLWSRLVSAGLGAILGAISKSGDIIDERDFETFR